MLDPARHDDEVALAKLDRPVAEVDGDPAAQDEESLVFIVMRMPVEDFAELGDLRLAVIDVAGDMRIEDLGDLLIRRLDQIILRGGIRFSPSPP
ncbi:hypothetical protein [Mesorhizobium sp.]|uniref:hypothetical protein n=1 Tax=Mesorhizobium sp. TaxID=1871066 RepID=UPI0025CC3DB5|nr:hypothetical protein [Mesorhizobium sp.]